MIKTIISIFLLILSISINLVNGDNNKSFPQPGDIVKPKLQNTINNKVKGTLNSETEIEKLNTEYIKILEKTNQQLSLWMNPYGIMIGALGVLFTILTLISVYIVYRQSKDYKENLNKTLENYKNSQNLLLDEYKKKIDIKFQETEETEKIINKIIEQYENKLKTSTKKQKDEIESAIDELKSQKKSLQENKKEIYVTPEISVTDDIKNSLHMMNVTLGIEMKSHICSECNHKFKVRDDKIASMGMPRKVKCPNCGHKDNW